MKQPCKNPCPECPYTNKASKGYFGGHDPMEYAQAIHQDTVIACHTRTKFNKETGTVDSDDDVVICTGHIVSQIKAFKFTMHPHGVTAHEMVLQWEHLDKLKEQALAFEFKQYHGIE